MTKKEQKLINSARAASPEYAALHLSRLYREAKKLATREYVLALAEELNVRGHENFVVHAI